MSAAGRLLAGRYRLERLVGRGGMSEVFQAHDEVLDRRVAVKVLLTRFAEDGAFVERFRQEAQSAASLNHPNIVQVYDTGEHDGVPFIVMELVGGRSLADAIRQGGVTEGRALEVCAEVCAALQYAHARGIAHRDIKPGNILLSDTGDVKVADFGIARAIQADTVTQTASVLGTAAYLSPEQAQGHPVDERTDIYSLGVVLYELLTGHQPFQGDSAVGVAYMHVQQLPAAVREWDDAVSPAAEAITFRAMAKNPANRYQSAGEFREDLMRARVGGEVSAPAVLHTDDTAILQSMPASRAPLPEGTRRRRRSVGYALLALFSIGAAVAAVLLAASFVDDDETTTVAVPNVRNRPVSEAQAILGPRGLEVEVTGEAFSDEVQAGSIVQQDPSPGTTVAPGTVIEVVVSQGREQVAVPDVTGDPVEDALARLRDAGLVPVNPSQEFSEEFPRDTVLRTTPGPGEQVPTGTQVSYVVSAGEETVRVRPVRGEPEADARFELEEQGLHVLVVREFSDEGPEGFVIRQRPEAGTEVEKGSEVTIVVSRGPREEPSPEPSPSPSPTVTEVPPSPSPSPSPTADPSPTESPS